RNGTPAAAVPLQRLSVGKGLVIARKDWSYNSTFLDFQSSNLQNGTDHESYSEGALNINRGTDALLVRYAQSTGAQDIPPQSTYGNAVVIDDGGAGEQAYRF